VKTNEIKKKSLKDFKDSEKEIISVSKKGGSGVAVIPPPPPWNPKTN
jgi:hypothetical protein